MTGIFLRVKRGKKWLNLEIEDLTEMEVRKWLKEDESMNQLNLINVLLNAYRDLREAYLCR